MGGSMGLWNAHKRNSKQVMSSSRWQGRLDNQEMFVYHNNNNNTTTNRNGTTIAAAASVGGVNFFFGDVNISWGPNEI